MQPPVALELTCWHPEVFCGYTTVYLDSKNAVMFICWSAGTWFDVLKCMPPLALRSGRQERGVLNPLPGGEDFVANPALPEDILREAVRARP